MKPVWIGVVGCAALSTACGGPEGTIVVGTKLAESAALEGATQVGSTLELPTESGGALVIERVRIAVGEVELDGEEDDDDDDDQDLPGRIVEVALDGRSTDVEAKSVQEGTYDELELELLAGAFPEFEGDPPASILVDGTFEGAAFTYRSKVMPELDFTIAPAIEVREGADARVAVTFDVAAWFVGDSGALDPRAPENEELIEQAILRSMAAHAEVELDD